MKINNSLEVLPINFRHEKKFLQNNNLESWETLKKIKDTEINEYLQKDSLCTESRFKKIRAIANFVTELKITPNQAYLLLHSGIGSIKALSELNPHTLSHKIGRLERSLNIKTNSKINQIMLKDWILKAKNLL